MPLRQSSFKRGTYSRIYRQNPLKTTLMEAAFQIGSYYEINQQIIENSKKKKKKKGKHFNIFVLS